MAAGGSPRGAPRRIRKRRKRRGLREPNLGEVYNVARCSRRGRVLSAPPRPRAPTRGLLPGVLVCSHRDPASPHKPAALKGGAAERTAEDAVVAVHVQGKSRPPPSSMSISPLGPLRGKPAREVRRRCRRGHGRARRRDGAAGDVFALFDGREPVATSPTRFWATLRRRAGRPRGRDTRGQVYTAARSHRRHADGRRLVPDGTSRYMLLGGVDDEGDIADAWLLTTRSAVHTMRGSSSKQRTILRPRHELGADFVWKPKLDADKDDRTRVVVFGGCQHQGDGGPKCYNDVWIATVPQNPAHVFYGQGPDY